MYWTSIKNNKLKEENDRINLVVLVCFVPTDVTSFGT